MVWDHSSTHEDDEVEAVVRAAAGRLVLLYLPTYSPWQIPVRCCGHIFAVSDFELFESLKALLTAAQDFFDRYSRYPEKVLSIMGADPT